ncbi:MAG TPA: ABC transporter substrate-binding protein [Devosia sp.]|jgi:dipeptide transport system substrate-binding protein|nr:ABC transporter substrate-binding protein [Devosia sp.]
MKLTHTLLTAAAMLAVMTGSALADKTLVYCSEGSPGGFDPGFYEDGTTQDVQLAAYEGLTKFKLGTTEVQPSLAEKWDISKDGLTYTFHLRHGVKWQTTDWFTPTREMNADDVVYSFQRQLDGKPYDSTQTYAYFGDMGLPDLIAGVKKVDDYTVEIDLKTPNSPFIADMAMPFAEIISKEYADSLAAANNSAQMNDKPVGTGPFIFVDYEKDANIRYKANPDWWGGKVKIDSLVFAINTDATARLQALIAGDCQIMAYPNPADVASIKANKDLTAIQESGLNAGWLSYNVQQKPFDNVDVRRALDYAIDKEAIIKAVYQGQGAPATTLLPPSMWGFNKSVKGYSYDPAKAKALLAKAGVKDLTVKLWAMPVSRPYMPDGKTTAQMIQADWAKVGVTANIYTVDWAEYLKDSKPHDRDGAVMIGWTGDNGDPDNFFTNNFGCAAVDGGNRSEWCNKDFDALLKQAAEETDQAKRAALYEKAQVIMNDDDPAVLIAHSVVTMPMSKKVTGYTIDPFGLHHFETVDIAE